MLHQRLTTITAATTSRNSPKLIISWSASSSSSLRLRHSITFIQPFQTNCSTLAAPPWSSSIFKQNHLNNKTKTTTTALLELLGEKEEEEELVVVVLNWRHHLNNNNSSKGILVLCQTRLTLQAHLLLLQTTRFSPSSRIKQLIRHHLNWSKQHQLSSQR